MDSPSPRPRVLAVVEDADLQVAFHTLLSDEGYTPRVVSGLEDALSAVAEEPFDLIVAQLYVGQRKTSLTPAHILRRRIQPIPIGLLTTQVRLPADVASEGFAFVMPMPFDLNDLLTAIAAALASEWTSERERQAE
jgi:CheY-like chemotaxis protein